MKGQLRGSSRTGKGTSQCSDREHDCDGCKWDVVYGVVYGVVCGLVYGVVCGVVYGVVFSCMYRVCSRVRSSKLHMEGLGGRVWRGEGTGRSSLVLRKVVMVGI